MSREDKPVLQAPAVRPSPDSAQLSVLRLLPTEVLQQRILVHVGAEARGTCRVIRDLWDGGRTSLSLVLPARESSQQPCRLSDLSTALFPRLSQIKHLSCSQLPPASGRRRPAWADPNTLNLDSLAPLTALTSLQLRSCNITNMHPLQRLAGSLVTLTLRDCAIFLQDGAAGGLLLPACPLLTWLTLAECRLQCVPDLTGCVSLTSLDLSNNGAPWAGANQLRDLHALSGCRHLQVLDVGTTVSSETLVDISALSRCIALTRLNLDHHVKIDDLSALSRCSLLEELSAELLPRLSSLQPLAACVQLKRLLLRRCRNVIDITPLASCHDLRVLDLSGTAVCDISALKKCSRLRQLSLKWGGKVSDISVLSGLASLESCDLSSTAVTSLAPLQHCSVLMALHADGCYSLADITPLATCSRLMSLGLSNTAVSDIRPLAACPLLEKLNLSNCNITDIAVLSACKALSSIELRDVRVMDLHPLAACTSLTKLDLSRSRVLDLGPLAGCSALRNLNLSHTCVTDVGALATCSTLAFLDLADTAVTDVSALVACTALVCLDVRGCDIATASLSALAHVRVMSTSPEDFFTEDEEDEDEEGDDVSEEDESEAEGWVWG